jgi:hypothetical protein
MTLAFDQPFQLDRSGPPGTLTLRGRSVEIRLEGVEAEGLPGSLPSLSLEEAIDGARRQLTLRAGSAVYPVILRHWRAHQPLPELYSGTLARFSPSAAERLAARLLVATAALPGATTLYRLWHAWRSR